jgi:hypothetical protein
MCFCERPLFVIGYVSISKYTGIALPRSVCIANVSTCHGPNAEKSTAIVLSQSTRLRWERSFGKADRRPVFLSNLHAFVFAVAGLVTNLRALPRILSIRSRLKDQNPKVYRRCNFLGTTDKVRLQNSLRCFIMNIEKERLLRFSKDFSPSILTKTLFFCNKNVLFGSNK